MKKSRFFIIISFFFIFLIFIIPSVLSVEAEINCPSEVYFNKEFKCDIIISEVDDIYDLKLYIKKNNEGINRILEDDSFRRADWYLKGFVKDEKNYEISLIIYKELYGSADGEFKLRDSSGKIVLFNDFKINILESEKESIEEDDEDEKTDDEDEKTENEDDFSIKNNKKTENEEEIIEYDTRTEVEPEESKKIIKLNEQIKKEEEIIYKSKNELIKEYVIYAFIFFLICIICILLLQRIW
jgi:hypothetical protein